MNHKTFGLAEYYREYPHAAAIDLMRPYPGGNRLLELQKAVARHSIKRNGLKASEHLVKSAVKKMREAAQPLDTLCLEALGMPVRGRPAVYDFAQFKTDLELQPHKTQKALAESLAAWWWTANRDSSDACPNAVVAAAKRYLQKNKKKRN